MTQLFRDHARFVHQVAVRAAHGDFAAAEDATQGAFIEAFSAWREVRELPPAEQRSFLCQRAKWRVIDAWRQVSNVQLPGSVPDEQVHPDPQDIALSRIELERCLKVIGTMSPRAQQVAYLMWHEQWTKTRIAAFLRIDRATVLRDLQRVAAAIKEQIGNIPGRGSDENGEEA